MLNYLGFPVFTYLFGLFVFSSNRKHLLLMLLALEFIVLSLYYLLFMCLSDFNFEYYFGMVFLTISVCESSLGLSILVSMIRSHGSDYFQSFNILW